MQLQRRAAVGCGPCPSAAAAATAVHDRQAVRKHLRRWSHNMVLIIGLERIAEELMGRRKWHQYQDILAKNYLLEEELMDRREWVPVKTCNSCDVNTDLNVTDHSLAELEPSSETGSLSGGSRSAESPEPEPGRRSSSTPPPAALKPCRAHDRSPSPLPQPPPSTSSLLQELSKNPAAAAAAAAAMAAVVSLNNASSSQSSKTSAGGPPSPNALDAAAVASGLPQWLLIEATRRLQETAAAAVAAEAAAKSRSPLPERRGHHHHQQPQQQTLDQPLDLSAKSNSNNGSSSPSDAKNVPGPAIIPFPSDLTATDMVNSLSNLIPNASLLQSLKVPSLIAHNRNVFKSKTTKQPSHMPGRKTYTEEKLQKALRDIQSGKLGTRRAAVIYGIPRSTLRNKVYKMAMERESGGAGTCRDDVSRESAVAMLLTPEDEDDDDRDTASAGEEDCPRVSVDTVQTTMSAADEDKDGRLHHVHRQQPKTPSFVTVEDLFRITTEQQQQQQVAAGMPTPETIRLFLQHYANSKLLQQARQQEHYRSGANARTDYRSPSPPPSAARLPPPMAPDLWPAAAAVLDPSKYLTQFLTTSVTATAPSPRLPSSPPPMSSQLPPRPRNPQEFFKDVSVMEMMTKLLDDEQKQYGKSVDWRRRLSSNGCNSSEPMDTGRCNDDDSNSTNFILRIPTYKTMPGKGSEYESMGPVRELQSTPERANSVRSDTSSPPSSSGGGGGKHPVSLRDVIAKSITHKLQTSNDPPVLHHMPAVDSIALAYHQYQQQQQQQQGATAVFRNHNNNNLLDDYRKRVPTPTSKPTSGHHTPASGPSGGGGGFHHAGVSSNSSASAAVAAAAAAAAAISGGKGTRPKRGKYRNYDRDSLVEAVRAVQRGEMSVHRAGSFYGVPHSTLEYKVKERHLLRTRKREPKNRPSASSVSADTATEQERKNSTDPLSPQSSSSSSLSVRPVDKCASSAGTPPAVKLPAHVFPSQQASLQTPNGLKMFDTATGVPVGAYQQPFPFWAPNPFHMPIDFQRNPVQAYTSMSMIQRIQAESRLHHHHQQQQQATATATASITSLGKNAREVAENLYDGTDNGSFLDGIIRSSLETGLKSAAAVAAVQAAEKSGGGGRPVAASDSSPERGVPNDRRSPSPPPPAQDEDGNDGRSDDEQAATTPARFDGSASSTDGEDEKPVVGLQRPPPDGSEQAVSGTSSPERAVDAEEDNDDDWSARQPSKVKRVV